MVRERSDTIAVPAACPEQRRGGGNGALPDLLAGCAAASRRQPAERCLVVRGIGARTGRRLMPLRRIAPGRQRRGCYPDRRGPPPAGPPSR